MKKIILLSAIVSLTAISCESKRDGIIDEQKLINKQLTGLQDSMHHAGDSVSLNRMKREVQDLQVRFDSLNNELEQLNNK